MAFAPMALSQIDFEPRATTITNPLAIAALPNGIDVFIGSYKNQLTSKSQISIQDFYPPGAFPPATLYALPIATGGNDQPYAAAFDPAGNLWVVGTTDSDDFPLVNPIMGQKVAYRTAGFILEIGPGKNVLFASTISGHQPNDYTSTYLPSTAATSIAIDSAGNVYVGGNTDEPDFPTTPGAYRSGGGSASKTGFVAYTYLVKISSAGKLIYSTSIATGSTPCIGGSACDVENNSGGSVVALAADSSGAAVVGALYPGGSSLISKFAPDGSKILWTFSPNAKFGSVLGLALAQDSTGAIDILGQYYASVSAFGGRIGLQNNYTNPGLFAAKLSSTGSAIYATDLGRSPVSPVIGVTADAAGNAYFAGSTTSATFPVLAGVPQLGADFILSLNDDGVTPKTLFRFPAGTLAAPPTFAGGLLLLPGPHGSLLRIPPAYDFTKPAILGYANAASYQVSTGLYPGTIASIFGYGLPSSSAAVQITVNGQSAPVLYSGVNQINFQMPFSSSTFNNNPVSIQVTLPSKTFSIGSASTMRTIGIFTVDGTYAAALNQDGTVNSVSNPATAASVVSLFGTGAEWDPGLQTGAVAGTAVPENSYDRPEVRDFYLNLAPVLYFGTAPGLNNGVFQLNIRIPNSGYLLTVTDAGMFTSAQSNAVSIHI